MNRHPVAGFFVALIALVLGIMPSEAATRTWVGATSSNWGTASNWQLATVPVAADTTIFHSGTNLTVSLGGSDRAVRYITFDTNAGSFTISPSASESFLVNTLGAISILSTIAGSGLTETINAPIVLGSGASAVAYSFTNDSATSSNTLVFGGQISGGTTGTSTLTLNGANTGNNQINGSLVNGAGTLALTKSGAGTWTLSGANTHTGLTSVTAGTLAAGVNNALGTGALTVNGATAVYDLGANHTDTVGLVSLTNGGSITGTGTSTLTTTGSFALQSGSVSASLAGSGVGLYKTSTGTVTLSGSNSYTGPTSVTGGMLGISGAGTLGATSSPLTVSGATTVLDLGGTTQTVGNVSITSSTVQNGSLVSTGTYGAGVAAISANLHGVGASLSAATSGTLVLSGSNTYTGGTFITGGSVVLGIGSNNALGSGDLTITTIGSIQSVGGAYAFSNDVNWNSTSVNATLSSGTNNLTFGGLVTMVNIVGGTRNILNNNTGLTTFSGGIALPDGTSAAFNSNFQNPGSITVNSTISDGSTNFGSNVAYRALGGVMTLSGSNTFRGALSMTASDATINLRNNHAMGAAGGDNVIVATNTLEFQNNISIVGEVLQVAGSGYNGNGVIRNISGSNSFAGVVSLSADATIKSESGVLTFSTSGSNAVTGIGRTLSLDGAGDIVFAGTITTGTGALIKGGAGTTTLGAVNTYTGVTTVNAGTLLVTGGLAGSSAITVNGGKFSAGSGVTISNEITVNSGGRIGGNGTYSDATGIVLGAGAIASPGNSPGNTTYSTDLTFSSASIFEWELGAYGVAAGTDSDMLTITGAGNVLTFDSGSLLTLTFLNPVLNPDNAGTGDFWLSNHQWLIADAVSGGVIVNNGLAIQAPSSFTNGTFSISNSGGDVYLNYASVVPEPGTSVLIGLGLVGVLYGIRRRKA